MNRTHTTKEKISQLIVIFLPILISQIGLFSINFFDTLMSGKASPSDLAGVAIGTSLWIPFYNGISGVFLAVTPIVAKMKGSGNNETSIQKSVLQTVYLAFLVGIIVLFVGIIVVEPTLEYMNLTEQVRSIAYRFLVALSFGIIPLFIYNVIRSFFDGLGQTRTSMFITLSSLPFNIFLNYTLIFGKFGMPALGGVGAGIAAAATYWFVAIISILMVIKVRPFADYQIFSKIVKPDRLEWANLLKVGMPIGLSIFFETSIFSAVTLLMSNYDTITIASHQAALNFSSFLYMVPLSFAMALTIVVGHEAGAERYEDARKYSRIGIGMALCFSVCSAIILFLFRYQIAGLYTTDATVLSLTAHFLLYAIFFQLSDAIQAPIQGALRGYHDVNITFIMSLVSYWIIGLPLGYLMGEYTSLGAFGYWIGLIAGLAAGAICLTIRLIIVQEKFLKSNKMEDVR